MILDEKTHNGKAWTIAAKSYGNWSYLNRTIKSSEMAVPDTNGWFETKQANNARAQNQLNEPD